MGLHVPSYTVADISFGPGILKMGASGSTPSVDVGAITEDGISIEPQNTTRDITQGNPKTIVYTFNQVQGVMVKLTGIEWDFTNLSYALGAGNTTTSAAEETFAFGGDALTKTVALHIQHQMAVSGNTMDAYIWTAVSEADVPLAMGHDEHQFAMAFKAQRTTADWAGATLPATEQLMKLVRTL